jgi:hypothetical protein
MARPQKDSSASRTSTAPASHPRTKERSMEPASRSTWRSTSSRRVMSSPRVQRWTKRREPARVTRGRELRERLGGVRPEDARRRSTDWLTEATRPKASPAAQEGDDLAVGGRVVAPHELHGVGHLAGPVEAGVERVEPRAQAGQPRGLGRVARTGHARIHAAPAAFRTW